MSETRLQFGKYRGCLLSSVPGSYLWWALEECKTLDPLLRRQIENELARRLPSHPSNTVRVAGPDKSTILDWCRRAAIACHPDHGGSTRAMKLINELRTMFL